MIRKRLLEPILLVVLTLAYYKLSWSELPGSVTAWGIPFIIVYVVFLPGNMLRKALSPQEQEFITRAVLGFLYGLFFFLFVTFLWALTRADLSWLRLNLPGWIFILYLVTHLRKAEGRDTGIQPVRALRSCIVLLLITIPLFIVVWKTGPPIGYTSGTLDHLAYVNEVQATGVAFPESAFYAEAGEYGRDIRKGLLHVFYGFTVDYLSIDGLRCLRIWNAVFLIVLICSIYGAAFILFGNQWIALLSAVFYIIGGIGGLDGTTLREAFNSNRFAYAYFLLLIAFLLRYLEKRDWRDLLNCVLFAFAASAVHAFLGVLSLFAIAIVLIWKTCFSASSIREHLHDGFICATAVAAGIFPYALYRYLTAYGGPNELHDPIQGMVFIGNSLFIENPMKLFSWFGLLGIGTFFIAPALWRHRKDSAGLGYLIAAGFTIPLLLLNPILLPPIHTILSYLVFRLVLLFPFHMLAAYYVVHFFGGIGGGKERTSLAYILLIGLFFAAVIDLLPILHESPVSPAALRAEKQNSYVRWDDGLAYLRDHVPEGTVIVSDPLTSYTISAFTPLYVTCVYDQYAPPGDRLLGERLKMTREILTPFSPVSTTIALMESMDADYIVLNNRYGGDVPLQYWFMQPDAYFAIREKFTSRQDLFRPRFHREGFLVLEWTGKRPEDVEIGANPYFLQEIPIGFSHIGRQAGEAKLVAYYIEKRRAEKGAELEISFVWSGTQKYLLSNYVVEVRFDHTAPGLTFGGKLFPKLARRAKEAFKGERYRFRVSHKILGGFLSPDVWPYNTFVLDPAAILIPSNAVSGDYTISVQILVEARMPNYHIRDVYFDDDIHQGIPIGSVTID